MFKKEIGNTQGLLRLVLGTGTHFCLIPLVKTSHKAEPMSRSKEIDFTSVGYSGYCAALLESLSEPKHLFP